MKLQTNSIIAENSDIDETITNQTTEQTRWSWACRILDVNSTYEVVPSNNINDIPSVGDVALFKVLKIGYHKRIVSTANKKIRLYRGDLFVGVFGIVMLPMLMKVK